MLPPLFEQPTRPPRLGEQLAKAIILAAILATVAIVHWFRDPVENSLVLPPATWRGLSWSVPALFGALMYVVFAWRIVLWRRYRPMTPPPDAMLPSISVVMPVYNEGELVQASMAAVAANRYPAGRIELIVIDDGSTDGSWYHILSGARRIGRRIRVVTLRQPRNLGKRRALELGFSHARGDVFVTVDSDSILHSDALRSGVAPLVADERIGCVAGCVRVLNPRQSLYTRFLKGTFSLSFKFVRAYQNEFRGVFCSPGALSFYRAEVVRRVCSEWVQQRFCGRPCTTGEDRAMTNLFLREGWLTAYQGSAVVWSKMPHTYAGVCRMFLRWARSNIRETIFLFRFLFGRFRTEHVMAFRLNILLSVLALVLPPLFVVNSLSVLMVGDPYLFHRLGLILAYGATVSMIYFANERDTDWVWLIVYEFFWAVGFWWIVPYAMLTAGNNGWLTRRPACRKARRPGHEVRRRVGFATNPIAMHPLP